MIVLLTTADTEVLAALRAAETLPADFGEVRAANPTLAGDPVAFADTVVDAGPQVVLVRLLGGRRAWAGFDRLRERCVAEGIALLAFSGEATPDAELTAASTAPAGVVAEAFEYLVQGGVDNTANLLRFASDTLRRTGYGFDEPQPLPDHGVWHPALGDTDADAVLADAAPHTPVVAIVFYRAHWMSGNTDFVAALVDAVTAAGGVALPVFCYSLRPDADGRVAVVDEVLAGRVDAVLATVLAMGGANAADANTTLGADLTETWQVPSLERLGVPIVQAVCATSPRAVWAASDVGLSALDVGMQVAMPEFDGRITSVPVSFKETDAHGIARYVADAERAARAAGTAVRLARLRHTPPADTRLAVVLSNYPTKHARIGNGVGLDTPASAVALLDTLTDAGYDTGGWSQWRAEPAPDGRSTSDRLVHELIAAGGFDAEFLTDDQLARNPARVAGETYAGWFAELDAGLRESVREQWGDPPGSVHVHDGELCFATLAFGNVLLAIQPPRGFGDDPIAIYHDPDLPPTHHYLGFYRWLEEEWATDAVIHLGKHGTLEWLPGKGVGASAGCAPDAALGDLPLVYPFIVNDPGEGTQAKRRSHAVIVDHLVPPMTRAETYDDLARLEQLLDEYEHVKAMDPGKLRAVQGELWQLLRTTELVRDLGWHDDAADDAAVPPDDLDDRLVDVDGYLCAIKDTQIRGGLHILGAPPAGEDLVGLVLALLRLPQAGQPGLRQALASACELDEPALIAGGGQALSAEEQAGAAWLCARFPGPARTAGDLIDRLEDAARALVEALDAKGWDADAAPAITRAVLGREEPGVAGVLELACTEVAPRVAATDAELDRCLDALAGRYVPSGPSGSPTRGRLDVLPTGKNFYSVDPKALPSELSWQVGQRLADDLVARYERDEGEPPASVGIVVWGTAAMRTHGDDVAEILALLGVRPRWHPESRRVVGLELIDVAELGRPRVDVTVRISGFFRDAFPHLVRLIDDAVALAAAADDEPAAANPIAATVAADASALEGEGVDAAAARRRASARVFGAKPGAYGAGLLPLIDARNWQTDADLAEVYATWGGHAYGRGLDGAPAREDMARSFSRVQAAVKNVDTREHDLLDSDDYFQEHGGMVALVRSLTGANPRAFIGDSHDPARVATRDLREETARVFRARVANPKWIDAMARHGYKGAFELAATVDYLFGYDATAGVVEDWMYATVSERYVFDDDTGAFLRESNPWALRAIAERLLEAADRGLWREPETATLERLRETYLELEGDLEEGAT